MTLYERIKFTAKDHGLTLQQVTERAGLGEKTVYKWKNQNPTADTLKKVADVLHVSVDYLLGNTYEPDPKTNEGKTPDLADDDVILSFEGNRIPP